MRLVFQDFAGEHEGVARRQHLDEIFLDFAEQPAAARDHLRRARAHQPHLQHVGLDDGADIHAVALRDHRMRDAPAAVLALPDLGEALVGLQRVAAGRDEIEHRVEIGAREPGIGRGARHLGDRVRRPGTARRRPRPSTCCASTSSAPVRAGGVSCAFSATASSAARHSSTSKRLAGTSTPRRRLVHAMVGAADALQQARGALRRADIDDEIDVAPVDAEIERRGADHRAQPAGRHRGLDLAALRDVERAVMQRDREVVVVDAPELLEDALGLAAGVDEDQRGLVALDELVDLADRVMARNARPRADARRCRACVTSGGAPPSATTRSADASPRAAAAPDSGADRRLGHRRREADGGEVGREREQPREAERQQIAALGGDQRVQLVEHDAPQRAEQIGRVGRGEEQRKLLGRGEQDVRRDRGAGAGASRPACRRCGSRCGSAAPSPRPAFRGCARCRPRAPSAARCRACAARPRGARRGRWR